MWLQIAVAAALVIPVGLDLYMPVPDSNPVSAEKVARGRELFFDKRLSRDGSRACASCHRPDRGFADTRPLAVGVFNRTGRRNAPALINRGYGRAFFWDARSTSLEEQVLAPITDPNEMDLSIEEASARVGLPVDAISQALASYVRSILSGNSRFDRFVNGDRRALSAAEQQGLQVFRGKGNCTACHVGPNFTDERTHNTGVAWQPLPRSGATRGARAATADSGQPPLAAPRDAGAGNGAFKTPTLREIERTGPFTHDGSLRTLEEVVEFYDRGGQPNPHLDAEIRPLKLTTAERRTLIAFLRTLSGEVQEGTAR
jgi:cytochrome c peroxidase